MEKENRRRSPEQQLIAEQGHEVAKTWVRDIVSLEQKLSIRVP
jgi:hypothetical protein